MKPELVLCILPQHGTEIRQVIKNWGDVKRSVSTQCVVCGIYYWVVLIQHALLINVKRTGKWEKANDQYCGNVALK